MMMIVMLKELDEQSEQSSTSAFHLLQSFLALLRLLLLLSALVESLSMFQELLGAHIVYHLYIAHFAEEKAVGLPLFADKVHSVVFDRYKRSCGLKSFTNCHLVERLKVPGNDGDGQGKNEHLKKNDNDNDNNVCNNNNNNNDWAGR